jgi:hypothetical protein
LDLRKEQDAYRGQQKEADRPHERSLFKTDTGQHLETPLKGPASVIEIASGWTRFGPEGAETGRSAVRPQAGNVIQVTVLFEAEVCRISVLHVRQPFWKSVLNEKFKMQRRPKPSGTNSCDRYSLQVWGFTRNLLYESAHFMSSKFLKHSNLRTDITLFSRWS